MCEVCRPLIEATSIGKSWDNGTASISEITLVFTSLPAIRASLLLCRSPRGIILKQPWRTWPCQSRLGQTHASGDRNNWSGLSRSSAVPALWSSPQRRAQPVRLYETKNFRATSLLGSIEISRLFRLQHPATKAVLGRFSPAPSCVYLWEHHVRVMQRHVNQQLEDWPHSR